MTLEVDDGQEKSEDQMILTVDNSAPHAAPGRGGVFEINTDVTLAGDVSDFDGDLYYVWQGSSGVICSGSILTVAGGTPVMLPLCYIQPGPWNPHILSSGG